MIGKNEAPQSVVRVGHIIKGFVGREVPGVSSVGKRVISGGIVLCASR